MEKDLPKRIVMKPKLIYQYRSNTNVKREYSKRLGTEVKEATKEMRGALYAKTGKYLNNRSI